VSQAAPLPSPPWGGMVAAYFLIIGVPSGLGILAWWRSAAHPRLGAGLERYANWISLATLATVSLLLVVDLGRPTGFFLMLTRFDNLGSPIAVGAKLIAIKLALLTLAVYGAERARRLEQADPALLVSPGPSAMLRQSVRALLLAASFALAVYPAAVLSRAWASPLSGNSGASLLFLLTALLLGAGTMLVVTAVAPATAGLARLLPVARRDLLVLLGAYAIALAFEALAVVGDPRLHAAVSALVSGRYAPAFWGGVLGVGLLVPAGTLVAFPTRRAVLVAAATAAAAGAFTARYLLFAVPA
jgi:formate-dependent nitrite reductase membrane component NrfD